MVFLSCCSKTKSSLQHRPLAQIPILHPLPLNSSSILFKAHTPADGPNILGTMNKTTRGLFIALHFSHPPPLPPPPPVALPRTQGNCAPQRVQQSTSTQNRQNHRQKEVFHGKHSHFNGEIHPIVPMSQTVSDHLPFPVFRSILQPRMDAAE